MASLTRIGVQVIAIDAVDGITLASVRNTYRLRMPAAVALDTAISSGSELASFDDALMSAAENAGVSIAR